MVMDNSKLSPLLHLLLLPLLLTPAAAEPQVPCYFIFGDSLVDNGNNNFRNTESRADYFPYGIDFPGGPTGRFSNGLTIADVIAGLLGFETYIERFANATDDDFIRGVNYGSGGAGILDETGRQLGDIISFNEQLWNHKPTISRVARLVGSKSVAKQRLSKCIYSVVIGNNDYLLNYLPQYLTSKSPYTPEQFAKRLINQFSKQLKALYKYGARKVAVFNLGRLGCIPQQTTAYPVNNATLCVEPSNDAVQLFNQKLILLIHHLNNRFDDATFLIVDPGATTLGNITNVTQPCCAEPSIRGDGACLADTIPCANRDEYFFWDLNHPSEAANKLTGEAAYDNMAPLLTGGSFG